jgi:hypothetical protein
LFIIGIPNFGSCAEIRASSTCLSISSKPNSLSTNKLVDTKTSDIDISSQKLETPKVDSVMINIHQFSTPTIKQTSTLMMPKHFKMCDVFSSICSKRKFDKTDYKFLFGDGKSEVPMDECLTNLNVFEFCLISNELSVNDDIAKDMASSLQKKQPPIELQSNTLVIPIDDAIKPRSQNSSTSGKNQEPHSKSTNSLVDRLLKKPAKAQLN